MIKGVKNKQFLLFIIALFLALYSCGDKGSIGGIYNLDEKLAVPGNLSATALSSTRVRLEWSYSSNFEKGFLIERSIDDRNFEYVAEIGKEAHLYYDTNLNPSTLYFYRVRASSLNGISQPSNTVSTRTFDDPDAVLPAPGTLNAIIQSNSYYNRSVHLFWENVTGEDGYRIERKEMPAGSYTEIASVGANVQTYDDFTRNLPSFTTYKYRVRAFKGSTFSEYSPEKEINTGLATPWERSAQGISETSISYSWKHLLSGTAGFKIYRNTIDYGEFSCVASSDNSTECINKNISYSYTNSPTERIYTYEDTGLPANPSQTYYYRVKAFTAQGESLVSMSSWARVMDPQNPPPQPVTNLTAQVLGHDRIKLDWTPSPDADGYKVSKKADSDSSWATYTVVNPDLDTYTFTQLIQRTLYHFRVVAYKNVGGDSAPAEISATTSEGPPQAPSGLSATAINNSSILLNWTDNSDNETHFKIERSIYAVWNWVELTYAVLGPGSNSYLDNNNGSGLAENTRYAYRIYACNSYGCTQCVSPYIADAITDVDTPPDLFVNDTYGNPTIINYNCTAGQNDTDAMLFLVTNIGGGTLYWFADITYPAGNPVGWLALGYYEGEVNSVDYQDWDLVPLHIDCTGFAIGDQHTGIITFCNDNDSSDCDTKTLNVTAVSGG